MSQKDVKPEQIFEIKDEYAQRYGFRDENTQYTQTDKGLSEDTIRDISRMKNEPEWMLQKRLDAYKVFVSKPMPTWGPDLSAIDFTDVYYYSKPQATKTDSWDKVPEDIKKTFDKLGIPESEKKFFGGAEAQYDSEVIYHNVRKDLEDKGVIFTDTDNAVKTHPEIMKKYFGTLVPASDNKFAALNTACWSGGSFIYVPKGVKLTLPLQAYFRINTEKSGQFERTLIIADEGADVVYVEGCLPADELVSKGDIFEPIANINTADQVVTHMGETQKVNQLFVHQHDGLMYEIIPQSGFNGFRLTGEHPVLCIKRKRVLVKRARGGAWLPEVSTKMLLNTNPEFVKAKELEDGDFLVYVAPTVTENDSSMTDDVLRILGLYLAEGSVSKNKALQNRTFVSFSFGCSEKEKELATSLHQLLNKNGFRSSICRAKGKYYMVSSYSKKLAKLCETHCGKGAATKKLSATIMKLDPLKQKLFVDYYWKGDGNIYTRNGKKLLRVSTASKILSLQIQEILARNGIFANLNVRKGSEDLINGRKIVRKDQVVIEYTEHKNMGDVKKRENSFFVPIKRINKKDFSGPVYNFSVNKDESYLVRGFAVHNCTAPIYSSSSLHSAVVEIVVHKNAHVRYVTIQNWSKNVYNLVTQRAFVYENGAMEWIDCNIGSKINMKYPSIFLKERGSKGEIVSVAIAGEHQIQDSGGKIYHLAPDTTSKLISKGVSKGSGVASYRGLMHIDKRATNVKTSVRCDSLLLGDGAKANTYPYMEINSNDATIAHEASVSKISDENLFYLMSRGISEEDAVATIVFGFINDLTEVLPLEYSLELKRLIKLDTAGSVG